MKKRRKYKRKNESAWEKVVEGRREDATGKREDKGRMAREKEEEWERRRVKRGEGERKRRDGKA